MRLLLLQTPIVSPSDFLATNWGSCDLRLGLGNLLEWLGEFRGTLGLFYYIIKDTDEQRNEEEYRVKSGRIQGTRISVSIELGIHHFPNIWICSPTWSLSEPPTLGIFKAASSC